MQPKSCFVTNYSITRNSPQWHFLLNAKTLHWHEIIHLHVNMLYMFPYWHSFCQVKAHYVPPKIYGPTNLYFDGPTLIPSGTPVDWHYMISKSDLLLRTNLKQSSQNQNCDQHTYNFAMEHGPNTIIVTM